VRVVTEDIDVVYDNTCVDNYETIDNSKEKEDG
jgi:hypothetical protein